MEIRQRPDFAFELSQEGYIRELLRSYNMEDAVTTKLPCPREWLNEGEGSEDENFTTEELKRGQMAVGEQLWLMMRCRPDLQFPVGFMAAKVSKQPNRVVQIAKRLLSYLKTTATLKMVIGGGENATALPEMAAWSDASFSPFGEKSYGASVVTINGYPIAWKASKQAFVTLSVMEAELLEASTATLLMENIGCLLDEICGTKVARQLFVDNASAVSMMQGGPGSWRTRHLKVRSSKIRELVETQELVVKHVNGTEQLADLATKMHPKIRLWELLSMWNFEGLPGDAMDALQSRATYLACLVLAMMCQPSQAEGLDESRRPVQVTGIDELLLVTLLVCVTTVAVWEAAKWIFSCLIKMCKESPRQKKLRKLREAAKAAAEEEVDRAVGHRSQLDEPTTPREDRRAVTPSMPMGSDEPAFPTGCVFEHCPADAFYKTDSHRSRLHADPKCHGLRNAGPVYKVEYCVYCSKNEPLFVKRSRSTPRRGF